MQAVDERNHREDLEAQKSVVNDDVNRIRNNSRMASAMLEGIANGESDKIDYVFKVMLISDTLKQRTVQR